MSDDLIARLESASEGSRELDAEIAAAVGQPHGPLETVDYEARSVTFIEETAPHYTTSLDAALTLVPEGMGVELTTSPRGLYSDAKVIEPVVSRTDDGKRVTNWKAHAAKTTAMGVVARRQAALAVVIAALRARQHKSEAA